MPETVVGDVAGAEVGDVIGTAGGGELGAQNGGLVPEEAVGPDLQDANRQSCFRGSSSRGRGPGGQPSVSGYRAQTVGGAGSCEASEALVRSLLLVLIVTNVSLGSGVTRTDNTSHTGKQRFANSDKLLTPCVLASSLRKDEDVLKKYILGWWPGLSNGSRISLVASEVPLAC